MKGTHGFLLVLLNHLKWEANSLAVVCAMQRGDLQPLPCLALVGYIYISGANPLWAFEKFTFSSIPLEKIFLPYVPPFEIFQLLYAIPDMLFLLSLNGFFSSPTVMSFKGDFDCFNLYLS
jgi:hypothetical protein